MVDASIIRSGKMKDEVVPLCIVFYFGSNTLVPLPREVIKADNGNNGSLEGLLYVIIQCPFMV